jgi:hypothetical protein
MGDGSPNGNNPVQWSKLLELLDEKLQLGLLDKLRRITAYHFEAETLIIEPGSSDDEGYLQKPATKQQLAVFAQDATGVTEIKIRSKS